MNINNLVAHIPARAGSKRVPAKNLRLMHGKPMIAYAIECAKSCLGIDTIYVNTDCQAIMSLAREYGVKVYQRSPELAQDASPGDDVVADIMRAIDMDTLLMVNPVCPLIQPEDVTNAIEAYESDPEIDTLISCSETQMQAVCEGMFVNIDPSKPLRPSQLNPKIQVLNWAVTIWNSKTFLRNYAKGGGAYIGTKRLLFPIPAIHSVKVSNEEDFRTAAALIASRKEWCAPRETEYWGELGVLRKM